VKSENEWIQAGFFLVTEGIPALKDQQFLPPRIITASACMADVYPDERMLSWVKTSPEELAGIRDELKLSESEFEDLRALVDQSFESGFGWPRVILDLTFAREFNRRYLQAVRGVHLLGMCITADDAEKCRQYIVSLSSESAGETGFQKMFSRRQPCVDSGVFLGFDVIGPEYYGAFHTFSCDDLAKDFVEKLGITFNAHGLIPDEEKAFAAAEYANREETGAELVPWFAVKLYEYDLTSLARSKHKVGSDVAM